ncbi:hypothetical protein AKG11_28400 [Shinella sp. SUS2]|uniref:hypothetical protein n=1 Tax=unclassified Shinella TaxID=2643062 RepID=UPI000680DF09|nr:MULTISPECIES: hypothetical protein [unclassified Shinella]KNY13544.1 hypothetical protein AKG11_28400 [Shinella sp. SUS2]KOC72338.1 hypothetical protein AKG10_27770 [Shinella sp. GWS1]
MESELKLYQKKQKLMLGGLGVAALLTALVVVLISGPDPSSVFGPLRVPAIFYPLGLAGLALTLYLLRFVIASLRNPVPRVILSAHGVTVDGFSGRFRAPWEEIKGYTVNSQSTYVLHLKDAQAFLERIPPGRAKETARALVGMFGSPLLIETKMLDVETDTIEAFLGKYTQELGT